MSIYLKCVLCVGLEALDVAVTLQRTENDVQHPKQNLCVEWNMKKAILAKKTEKNFFFAKF